MITKLSITLILLTLVFTACEKKETSTTHNETKEQKVQKEQTEPKESTNTLTLTATNGKHFKLEATESGIKFDGLEGKVVLLDFFATWCPPCRAEMPHLVNLQKKYDGKIQILSILMEEEKDNAEAIAFAQEHHLNFPILNSKENFFLSQALGGIRSLPTLVMYDKSGNYFTHYTGAAPEEMIESDIKKALAK
jgi:thiol-disulfide isomerase/thioredoxin